MLQIDQIATSTVVYVVWPFESTLSVSSRFSASDVRGSPLGMLGLSFSGAGTSAMAASRLKQG